MSWAFLRIGGPRPWRLWMAPLMELKPHEEFFEDHFRELLDEILRDGVLKMPLLVDATTLIILDGHHRYQVLRTIGAKYAPVYLVDYLSPKIRVGSWREGVRVSKEMVIRAGLTGRRLPAKTSRHILNGVRIPEVNIPLSVLRGELQP